MIIINARRWFDKTWGNTYHSVSVKKDGVHIGSVDFAYGYDRQYLQTAHKILADAGLEPEDYNLFLQNMMENREYYHEFASDVGRKKDL